MKIWQTFKTPRFLACFISFALMPVSYLGLRLCSYLDSQFPVHYTMAGQWSYFGHFDLLAVLFYLTFFAGALCSAICCLGLLIAGIMFLFRRKHPKQI